MYSFFWTWILIYFKNYDIYNEKYCFLISDKKTILKNVFFSLGIGKAIMQGKLIEVAYTLRTY